MVSVYFNFNSEREGKKSKSLKVQKTQLKQRKSSKEEEKKKITGQGFSVDNFCAKKKSIKRGIRNEASQNVKEVDVEDDK